MKIRSFALGALVLALMTVGWSACDAARVTGTTPTTPGSAGSGQTVFIAQCASCHGASAGGSSGPDVRQKSEGVIRSTVRAGKSPMPAFSTSQLSEQDIVDIAAYLATL